MNHIHSIYLGTLKQYNNPPQYSHITLQNLANSYQFDTTAKSTQLKDAGITSNNDAFYFIIEQTPDGLQSHISPIPSHPMKEFYHRLL
jgi:hypothetical protein